MIATCSISPKIINRKPIQGGAPSQPASRQPASVPEYSGALQCTLVSLVQCWYEHFQIFYFPYNLADISVKSAVSRSFE